MCLIGYEGYCSNWKNQVDYYVSYWFWAQLNVSCDEKKNVALYLFIRIYYCNEYKRFYRTSSPKIQNLAAWSDAKWRSKINQYYFISNSKILPVTRSVNKGTYQRVYASSRSVKLWQLMKYRNNWITKVVESTLVNSNRGQAGARLEKYLICNRGNFVCPVHQPKY